MSICGLKLKIYKVINTISFTNSFGCQTCYYECVETYLYCL